MISLGFSAHLVTTGLGPLFDGIGHVVVTPEDLLPVIALALLAGLGGKAYGRKVLFILPAAWLVGGLLGIWLEWSAPLATTALSFLVIGGLVATFFLLDLIASGLGGGPRGITVADAVALTSIVVMLCARFSKVSSASGAYNSRLA